MAELTISWSRPFNMRSSKMVLHCDRMVGSISAGSCDDDAPEAPYLRPSLATWRWHVAGLEAEAGVGGHFAVSLLADEGHRDLTLTPWGEVESQTVEHGHHHFDDIGGQAGELQGW
jgi:hypothetical protein